MKICILANAAAVHTQRWASAYAARGHEVAIISINSADLPGVEVLRVGRWGPDPKRGVWAFLGYLTLLLQLRRRLSALGPDVVHAHYTITHGAIAGLASTRPVVLSAWGTDVRRRPGWLRNRLLRTLNRRALRAASVVTATSRWIQARVAELSPSSPPARLVPFGVDSAEFSPIQRPDGRPFTVAIIKSLRARYGHADLIRAMSSVVAEIPEARLLIAGDGPERRRLHGLVAELNLGESVEFLGAVPHREIPRLLERADVVANPSHEESFGVAVLEAAAAGLPVVAARVEGLPEVVADRATGLLVPPHDPGALAAALVELGTNPARRARMGGAGRELVAAKFSWEDSVDTMLEILEDASRLGRRERAHPLAATADSLARTLKRSPVTDTIIRRPARLAWDALTGLYLGLRGLVRGPMATLRLDGSRVTVDTRDRAIGRRLYTLRSYEMDERAMAVRLIPPGSDVIDVGAHIGYHTLLFSKLVGPHGRVMAIEAHPGNFRLLENNLTNNAAHNVTALQTAVGSHEGDTMLVVSRDNSGMHHLVGPSEAAADLEPVKVTTLDGLLEAHGLEPGFVKIDVEGAEVDVLRGASRIVTNPTVTILCEVNPSALARAGHGVGELLDHLQSGGRRLHVIGAGRTLEPISAADLEHEVDLGRHVNVVALAATGADPT